MKREAPEFTFEEPWLSKSGVLEYAQCPNRWWRREIMKMEFEKSGAMRRGIAFHELLYHLFNQVDQDGILSEDVFIEDEYRQYLPDDPVTDNFINLECTRFANSTEVEREHFFPLYREIHLRDPELLYYGTIDRVDSQSDGSFVVLDYKTGKKRDWLKSSNRFELNGYRHLVKVNDLVDGPITHIAMVFLGNGGDVLYERPSPQSTAAFYKKVARIRSLILDRIWDKNITMLCDYCGYARECLAEEGIERQQVGG